MELRVSYLKWKSYIYTKITHIKSPFLIIPNLLTDLQFQTQKLIWMRNMQQISKHNIHPGKVKGQLWNMNWKYKSLAII